MAYEIYRVNPDSVVTFAAQELKKYLRMMMPRCGKVLSAFDPEAKAGFRLGLMSDFGIDPDVDDVYLDDVVYINTHENGGIIAGSNPRSVLLAVYRYLKKQGCVWLFPGPDGEQIPTLEGLAPVELLHKASNRYRGQCNEGGETQPLMMDIIDFTPKIGLNTFMIEFDIPQFYYERAYQHKYGCLEAEASLSYDTVLQWKRECEAEIAKRGLLFHDMGHGWTADPFGLDTAAGWKKDNNDELTDEIRQYLAQIDGVRGLFMNNALCTNLCMSNPKVRRIVAEYIAEYAKVQNNVDFLHVWLADASGNHCECEVCRTKTPSDWYIMMLNDIDEELTKRDLDTHIVFISYVDTKWAPLMETIRNNKRFTMLFALDGRSYCETYLQDPDESALVPYEINNGKRPKTTSANMAFLKDWKRMWKGDCFCYEYHFFSAQYMDPGSMDFAKVVYDDIQGLAKHGLSGIVEDCSQRSFFPTGFPFYVYGETLFDTGRSYEELMEEYFSAAFGENWTMVVQYLESISAQADVPYCRSVYNVDVKEKGLCRPAYVQRYEDLWQMADKFLPTILENRKPENRPQYVSWDLLKWHVDFVKCYANGMKYHCVGDTEGAEAAFVELVKTMAPLELLRYNLFDQELCMEILRRVFSLNKRPKNNEVFLP